MAAASYVCGLAVPALYLEDPGNRNEPQGFVLCSEMGSACHRDGCACRYGASAQVNGTSLFFGVCELLKDGESCGSGSSSGSRELVTCDSDDIITRGSSASASNSNEGSKAADSDKPVETHVDPLSSQSASTSASSAVDQVQAQSSTTSADTVSTPVMITIIVVCIVFVALVSWVVRSYCARKAAAQEKRMGRRMNFEAQSPTQATGTSSATPPSFPAFDRRSRAMNSPRSGPRDGRRSPHANAPRGRGSARAQRGPSSARDRDRAGNNGPRGYASPRSQPSSNGRGRGDSPHSSNSSGRRGDSTHSGSNRSRDRRSRRADSPHTSTASRDRALDIEQLSEPRSRDHRDAPRGQNGARNAGMQRGGNPRGGNGPRARGQEGMRRQEHQKRAERPAPRGQKPARQANQPSGGVVHEDGRDTIDHIALFAQQAAFQAPPPPPPRIKPQTKPIRPVRVAEPIPKNARKPERRAAPQPAPRRQPGPLRIDDDPIPIRYPSSAMSMAPSVASSATTVLAPGRRRVTPVVQERRQQPSTVAPPPVAYHLDSPNQSKLDDSFASEAPSGLAWSAASSLSDDSYYHAAPTGKGRIPVIDVPSPSEDGKSEVGDFSDWGGSTQQSADMYNRSTGASSASFFSVNSDFTDSGSVFQYTKKEREF